MVREKGKKGRRRVCAFCVDKMETVDYKDTARLRRYLSERGKLMPRRMTGNCAKHQRQMTRAAKQARNCMFLPFVVE